MISGYLVGDRELVKRLQNLPARVMDPIAATTQRLGYGLQAYVQTRKLTGQVLKVRTGRLRASITQGNADSRSRFERLTPPSMPTSAPTSSTPRCGS